MTTIEVPGRVKRRQVPNSLKGQFYEGELNPRFISDDALKMHRIFEVEQFFLSKNQITKFGTRPRLGFFGGGGKSLPPCPNENCDSRFWIEFNRESPSTFVSPV